MKILILTDHGSFAPYDSIFPLIKNLAEREGLEVFLASRSDPHNTQFFEDGGDGTFYAKAYDASFSFEGKDGWFTQTTPHSFSDFNGVWIRIDQPVADSFLIYLTEIAKTVPMINHPHGIRIVGSKEFLLEFPDLVKGAALCNSIEDVLLASQDQDIVLKTLEGYGGTGVYRVLKGGRFYHSADNIQDVQSEDVRKLLQDGFPYLSSPFLKNVANGDKRILVCGGEIIGCLLRVPRQGEWKANVAQGATVVKSEITDNERNIISQIHDKLEEHGILLYGIDTLEDDDGVRVLSEINPTNVGGLIQVEEMYNKPVIGDVVDAHVRKFSQFNRQ